MDDPTTQSVDVLRSHAERGNEDGERGNEETQEPGGRVWPVFVLMILAGATLVAIQMRRPKPADPLVGLSLPPLEVGGWLNIAGPLLADDLRGHVVLVDFWATDCPRCALDAPELADFYKRFREHGVMIVGLTHESGEAVARVKQYVEQQEIEWPIGYGAGFTFELMGVVNMPTYLLYDRTGRSVWGGHSLDGLEDATVTALAK